MNLRLIDLNKDYAEISSWWTRRGLSPVPLACLPSLGVIVEHGCGIAAGWCYIDQGGRIAVIDFITTNPGVAIGPTTTEAIDHIIGFFEANAKDEQIPCILSFVAKDTGLHRFMVRNGWTDNVSSPHILLSKTL